MKVYVYGEVPETTTSIIMVSGEGNKLCEEAIRLTQFTYKVVAVTKRDSIYATEYWQKAVLENPSISVLPFTEVVSAKECVVTVRDVRFGSAVTKTIPVNAYFAPGAAAAAVAAAAEKNGTGCPNAR